MAADIKDPLTHAILGAAFEVHKQLGHGFLEAVYQEALAKEFSFRDIPFQREVDIVITYKSEPLTCTYRADFLCFDRVIVEIKAISMITGSHESQVLNYLKATGKHVGLLLNFGTPSLQQSRRVWNYQGEHQYLNVEELKSA